MHARKKPSDVMTVEQLAAYLQLSKSSVYRLAQAGVVPGRKVGKHWRFHREAVDQWLTVAADVRSRAGETAATSTSGCIETSGIEEHAQGTRPWDLRVDQLSRGHFSSVMRYVNTPGMFIYEGSCSQSFEARDATPKGLIVLGSAQCAMQRPSPGI